jgi:hypothetical protein
VEKHLLRSSRRRSPGRVEMASCQRLSMERASLQNDRSIAFVGTDVRRN